MNRIGLFVPPMALQSILYNKNANRPTIPALNRWTKLYPAVAWWVVALLLHNLIPRCVGVIAPDAPDVELGNEELVDGGTENTYHKTQDARLKRLPTL